MKIEKALGDIAYPIREEYFSSRLAVAFKKLGRHHGHSFADESDDEEISLYLERMVIFQYQSMRHNMHCCIVCTVKSKGTFYFSET